MTEADILTQTAEKELLEMDIRKKQWSIDIKNDWNQLEAIEKNVYVDKRNIVIKDYSLGNLNYLKFYEYINIIFYAYNVNDNLISKDEGTNTLQEISLDSNTFKKVIPLHKILGGENLYTFEALISNQENIKTKDDFAKKIEDAKEELEELKNLPDSEDKKTKIAWQNGKIDTEIPNEYNSILNEHQTFIHAGWGIFYTYEINLDLEIFSDTSFDVAIPKIPPLNPEKIASNYLNYCPINIIPKVTLVPYRINMYGVEKKGIVLCKTKICTNNAPTYVQKISLGSMNTKAMKYSKIVGLNKKEASQILKIPKQNLEMSQESSDYRKRNETVVAADEEDAERDMLILKKKQTIKDIMTQNENKFC